LFPRSKRGFGKALTKKVVIENEIKTSKSFFTDDVIIYSIKRKKMILFNRI